jgi:antitoxin component of MazEF toxin-antitoxin module
MSVARHLGLSMGSEVELSIEGGRLVFTPTSSREVRLDSLLERIDSDRLHPEIETGGPMGNEFW